MVFVRINNWLKGLLIASLVLGVCSTDAQQYLDERCFLATELPENIGRKLEKGYRAFIYDRLALADKDIELIEGYLKPENTPIIFICNKVKPYSLGRLKEYIYAGPPDDYVFGPEFEKGQLYIFSNDGNFLNAKEYLKEAKAGVIDQSTNNLTVFKDAATLSEGHLRLRIQKLYRESGNLPNILVSDRPEVAKPVIDSINQQVYYHAIVIENGEKLSQVSWDTTSLKSNGKIHTQIRRVRPYKRGYMFSPDVINFNVQNASSIKVFRAHKRRLNDALRLDLDFNQNPDNSINPAVTCRYSNIEYVKDPERGWVGEFSGREKYIDFGNVLDNMKSEITISVWVYPYELTYNKSIVGVGESFSAKILDGNLVFTTPDIRDHINDSATIPKNNWSHVSFVYDSDQFVYFYINGQLTNVLSASGIRATSQSLIIGTNLWDEYFVGKMDDLRIWTRALSNEEIRLVYDEAGISSDEKSGNYWLYMAVVLVFPLFFLWKRMRGSNKPKQVDIQNDTVIRHSNVPSYHIRLFDDFHLKNQHGLNLTNQLSPQRKELFLLVLIYTIRKGGITTKEMTNTLWAGYPAESAKNNRSTQMVRLREILAKDTGVSLVYEDRLWKIRLDTHVSCDLATYQGYKKQLSDQNTSESAVFKLLRIVGNGALLPALEYEWLDQFKGEISNNILEILIPCFCNSRFLKNQQLMPKVTKAVNALDPLNEQALDYQLNTYLKEGKHALAKHTFEAYQKTYFNFYNESFSKNFKEYISSGVQLRDS